MITITHCSYNRYEPDESEFRLEFPNGRDNYTFYFILTSAKIVIQNHTYITTPNTILITTPHTPYFIYANQESYLGSYFRFYAQSTDMSLFKIPYNTPFSIVNSTTIQTNLSQICSRTRFRFNDIEQLEIHSFCTLLFCEIHNQLLSQNSLSSNNKNISAANLTKYQLINQVRTEVFSNLFYNWNIDMMAKKVHMSSKQFRFYYKKFFHCTPKEDLIFHRLNLAKIHLLSSDYSISEIAFFTGFQSIYHFTNSFTKKVGCSPSQYRALHSEPLDNIEMNDAIKC